MKATLFKASQFTPTKWDTAEDKAKFANHFVRFVESGFKQSLFPLWFYKRLSNTFGHIANFNQAGFWDTFFESESGRFDFVHQCSCYPCYGDPAFTYSDVETVLRSWLLDNNIVNKIEEIRNKAVETAERSELRRLKTKYEN